MEFPALMPKELLYCEAETSEDNLFALLVKKPTDLIFFFETASDDETWSELHADFMRKMIEWITAQAFNDRLSVDLCKRAVQAIHKHYAILERFIPQNIEIRLKDDSVQINSLLLAVASTFFRDILLRECRDQNASKLSFEKIPYELFSPIIVFVNTGHIPDLWKKEQNEVVALLHLGQSWRVESVVEACERTLKKYLTKENAIDKLLQAQQELWPLFKQICVDYINDFASGYRLGAPTVERLAFEFFDFSDATLAIFNRLQLFITDLICKGALSENARFGQIVRQCPKLSMLDVAGSLKLSEFFNDIPTDLQGISLAECSWLKAPTLKKMAEICPYIRHLDLSSNFQLNFGDWGELAKFKGLKSLNLSRCHQISDEDFVIILKACGPVTDLVLDECRKIGDKGFFELAKSLPRLTNLSLARCSISDSALLEIATRCRSLINLNLYRCDQLTERGLRELAKHARVLKELNLIHCNITPDTIHAIQLKHPYLHIILDYIL